MLFTCKFFTGDRLWRTHTLEIALFWCTTLIFAHTDGQCFVTPVVVNQSTRYTQEIHYNITSDWVFHNSPSVNVDHYGWHKSMAHFSSMCCSSHLTPQVIFYDSHNNYFYYMSLNKLHRHIIKIVVMAIIEDHLGI